MLKGSEFLGHSQAWSKKPELSAKMDVDQLMNDVVKPVNPDYGKLGTKMNCRRCTFAYEMRRRGLDVRANRSTGGTGQNPADVENAINPLSRMHTGVLHSMIDYATEGKQGPQHRVMKLYEATEIHGFRDLADESKASTIFETIAKHPDRARGELGVNWAFGGGHNMAWEIVNGKPVVFDNQTGKAYTEPAEFLKGLSKQMSFMSGAQVSRLDNQPLNDEFLRRWVQNAN